MAEWTVDGKKLKIVEGNIVALHVDAIVNAANKSLILGGGVAGAIRNFGGPSIQEECNGIGPVEVGEAVLTAAGNLNADYVIHAVGPVYGEGDEDIKLANATLNSLKIAQKKKIKSIAFPAISTGVYGYPVEEAAGIALSAAKHFEDHFDEIRYICFSHEDFEIYKRVWETLK